MCVVLLSFSPLFFFFQFSAFSKPPLQKQQGNPAKLSPTCAVEQADTPAEVERSPTCRVWTSVVILFYNKEGGYY